MSKILIIPDVHEDMAKVNRILAMYPDLPRVWLGDFFDSFTSTEESTAETCKLLNTILESEDDLCIGNHCNHYMFDHWGMRCSGYDSNRKAQIRSSVDMDKWRERAKLFHAKGDYVLAHAGFHPSLLAKGLNKDERILWLKGRCEEAVERATRGEFPVFFEAGYSRGGGHPVGGPNWLDWSDFKEIATMPQIVGHSKRKEVRQKGASYCIDTALRHVAILDDETNTVEIVEVKDEGQ